MMLKIACPCGHTGIVSAETLPRELTRSRCGASRHVGSGERIVNKVAVLEWLLAAPRSRWRPPARVELTLTARKT